mmetsp:Transcript_24254/g.33938  ORF Transcript_24254/g.33938 Transcript_24254/m.33938 type:complete len:473 (+) Transcript_24254:82-1500(+)
MAAIASFEEKRSSLANPVAENQTGALPLTPGRTKSTGILSLRRLYHAPRNATEWDGEYEERTSEWFELFVDLIMVVAFSRMSEFLAEDYTAGNVLLFLIFFNLFQSSWNLYASYCTRFFDISFLHTLYLIVFLLGMAGMTIHVGVPDLSFNFTIAMIVQRFSLFIMYFLAACQNRRAKPHALLISYLLICSLILFTVAAFYTKQKAVLYVLWGFVSVIEMLYDLISFLCLPREKLLPLNIDHYTDRRNAFILAVLGEAVLSAVQDYGSQRQREFDRNANFYLSMSMSLLLSFSIALLYYHVQPATRDQNAMRQSVFRGFFLYITTCCLAPALLLVGVSIKFITKATVNHHTLEEREVILLFSSLGVSLFLIFLVRISHYWGNQPVPDDEAAVKTVKWLWWLLVAIWPLVVISFLGLWDVENAHPLSSISVATVLCFGLAVIETCITHWLASREHQGTSSYGAVDVSQAHREE